jgi:hypothetical protein
MDVLRIVGDAMWILALTLMASASRAAWGKIAPGARVPLIVTGAGRVLARAPRTVALCLIPGTAFVVGAALLFAHGLMGVAGQAALIVFGLRLAVAPLFVLVHLRWLSGALTRLAQEGALRS